MLASGKSALQIEREWQERDYSFRAPERTDPLVVARYLLPRRRPPIFWREFMFHSLLPVDGLEILEIGCGDGSTSCLLAHAGARMTSVDISERAIHLARERARLDGVENRCQFKATPIQQLTLAGRRFDCVLADAVLHHLIPDLSSILADLRQALRPGGRAIFVEPVNLSPALRKFRLHLPVKVEGSPGERPLEAPEIELIRAAFPRTEIDYFDLFGRLGRFLPGDSYERNSLPIRFIHDSLRAVDWLLLHRFRLLRSFASVLVIQCWT